MYVCMYVCLLSGFLLEQLLELAPPEEWVSLKVGGIGKSPFIRQLKKETTSFIETGGFQALAQLMRSDTAMTAVKQFGKRRVTQMNAYLAATTTQEDGMDNNGQSKAVVEVPPDEGSRRRKRYPVEDTMLLTPSSVGRPDPINSPQLMPAFLPDRSCESYDLEEAVLIVYACVNNFRRDLQLPFIPLRALQDALAQDNLHPILREVRSTYMGISLHHIAILFEFFFLLP